MFCQKKGFILVLIGQLVLYVVSDLSIIKRSRNSRDGKTEKWLTHLQDGKNKNMVGSFPVLILTVAYLHKNYEWTFCAKKDLVKLKCKKESVSLPRLITAGCNLCHWKNSSILVHSVGVGVRTLLWRSSVEILFCPFWEAEQEYYNKVRYEKENAE